MAHSARLDATAPARGGMMSDTLLALDRIALAGVFLTSGFAKLVGLSGTAGYVASKGLPAPMVLAALAGLGEVVLGAAVVIGFKTRLAALGLAVFTVLATAFFHNFWDMEGADRMQNQIHAMKNLSIIGGLLILAAVGAGRLSADRR
jgi:putative oxidoreductase